MSDKRGHRSDKYQVVFHEVPLDLKVMESFDNSQSLNALLNPYDYDEEEWEIKDQLRIEFWKLAEAICTKHQFTVLTLICQGYTQQEVAAQLGVNQSSITKSLHGNVDYEHKAVYGGIMKKLKKAVHESPIFQDLFTKLSELEDEKY